MSYADYHYLMWDSFDHDAEDVGDQVDDYEDDPKDDHHHLPDDDDDDQGGIDRNDPGEDVGAERGQEHWEG